MLKKLIKGLKTKNLKGMGQYKENEKARAKYLTNPTKRLNPKVGKYF